MNSVQSSGGLNFQMCVISSFTGWNTYHELPQGFSVNYGDILGYLRGVSTYHGLITSKETLRLLNLFVRQIIVRFSNTNHQFI